MFCSHIYPNTWGQPWEDHYARPVTEAKGKVFQSWERNSGLHRSNRKRDTLSFGHKFSGSCSSAHYCTANTEKTQSSVKKNYRLYMWHRKQIRRWKYDVWLLVLLIFVFPKYSEYSEVLSSTMKAVEQIRNVFPAVSEEQYKATCLVYLVEQKLHGILTAK